MAMSKVQQDYPVSKLCTDLHRALVVKGTSFLRGTRRGKKNAGGVSWHLSLECFHERNRAECNLAVEMRERASLSTSMSRSDPPSPANSSGIAPKQGNSGLPISDYLRGEQVVSSVNQVLNNMKQIQTRAVDGAVHFVNFSTKSMPATVYLGVVVFVIIVGLIKLKESMSRKGQGVRTRILKSQWFHDSKQGSRSNVSLKQPSKSSWLAKSSSKREESSDSAVYNHLVIHDGQVITGGTQAPRKRKISTVGASESQRPLRSDTQETSDPPSTSDANRIRGFVTKSDARKPSSLFQKSRGFRRSFVNNTAEANLQPKQEEEEKDTSEEALTHVRKNWNAKDESDLRQRIDKLRKSVQAAEANRKAAMRALAEERKRSLELEVKISRQKEAALSLEEEVRVLKESHEMLLNSLRKKYSSSVAARAAAALLYQNWEGTDSDHQRNDNDHLQSVH